MATFKKYTGVPTITLDYKEHSGYLKDNSGNDLYLGFENGDSFIGNIDNFNENSTYPNTDGCEWSIASTTEDTTDNTNTGRKIHFKVSSTKESRTTEFKYDSTLLFRIYQDASELEPIEFEIIAKFQVDERILDDTSDYYDIYVSTVSLTLSRPLPFRLNVCVNLVYDLTLDDGSIDLFEQIEGFDWYFEANSTVGKPTGSAGDAQRPSVTMYRGNGGYGFHSIDFLDSTDTDHRNVGPGSHNQPTDDYADISYENKIYRCRTVNFSPNSMVY